MACPATQERICWTEIEATVKIHSAGENAKNGLLHAVSYTVYLLQARPDRVSVQGFYADANGVVLIINSADGVLKSPKLNLKDVSQHELLYAFVKRLYYPLRSMIDPTVKRRKQNSFWVFDITLTISKSPPVECLGYRIEKALGCVGRRTHIFVNNVNPTFLNGDAITVIKDQYCNQGHCFSEDEVLRRVHAEEVIPGVVHLVHSEDVISDGVPVCSGKRYKKRLCLVEYGKPFMDLKTPLDALEAIYDLLESESGFNILVFLLILFAENSYPTLVFQAQHSTSRYQLWKFTVYEERSPYCHGTYEKYFGSAQFLFHQAFIGSNVVIPLVFFIVKAKAQYLSVWRPVLPSTCWWTLIELRFLI